MNQIRPRRYVAHYAFYDRANRYGAFKLGHYVITMFFSYLLALDMGVR